MSVRESTRVFRPRSSDNSIVEKILQLGQNQPPDGLAFIDRIPPEILCSIFLRTLPYPIQPHSPPFKESISSPLRISHVCRNWREISLSYGELWSYLCVYCSFSDSQEERRMMVEIFDTFLSRTNGAPLSYVIEDWPDHYAEAPRDVEHIFTMLIQNQHRWKDVAFSCNRTIFSPQFPGFNLTNMPLLTSMEFHSSSSLNPTADFTQSLRLRSLNIHHDAFDLVTDTHPSTLHRVRLSSSYPSEYPRQKENIRSVLLCLTLLRANPYLRELCVRSNSLDSSMPPLPNGKRIVHSNLNDLDLCTGIGSKLPAMIIGAVTTPSLNAMRYVCDVGSEKLLRFFQWSVPPLTMLEIGCRDASEETLISILRLLPTVRHLSLASTTLSEWFFLQLTVSDGIDQGSPSTAEHAVCPGLSYLCLFEIPADDGPNSWLRPLLAMGKSRMSRFGTLKDALFTSKDGVSCSVNVADSDQYVDLINLDKQMILITRNI